MSLTSAVTEHITHDLYVINTPDYTGYNNQVIYLGHIFTKSKFKKIHLAFLHSKSSFFPLPSMFFSSWITAEIVKLNSCLGQNKYFPLFGKRLEEIIISQYGSMTYILEHRILLSPPFLIPQVRRFTEEKEKENK